MKYFIQFVDGSNPFAAHYPNPFKGVGGDTGFDRSTSDELLILDGGMWPVFWIFPSGVT